MFASFFVFRKSAVPNFLRRDALPTYGDVLVTEMKVRRREADFALAN